MPLQIPLVVCLNPSLIRVIKTAKATDQYFPVVLNKVVLTFEFVDETLKCDHGK